MIYRELGKTGMKLSNLSFGASSLGGVFHSIKEEDGIQAVHTAVERGINFIDVSPYYGFTKAETVLGKALKNISREKYYLSTKVGRFGADGVKSWDYSGKRAQESMYESLERLNINYVDIINVHDIEFSNLDQVINETLPALHEIKAKGLARHVGITGLPLAKLKYVVENTPKGTVETILSFCHYCLNDDALVDYLSFFEEHGVGIINASPLSMGLLSERGWPDWHPASDELKQQVVKAVNHCKSKNYRIEQLAMKFSVTNPQITTTLVSSANPHNFIENIRWAEEPQNEVLLQEVLDILKPVSRLTWENT
ncbi:MAG: aldo/keto reductase [Bacteroidetes bacterium]|nr:aldo/keto reductase [Bacteroidota bacterium]